MSCLFVSIQGTYNKIELALFHDSICIETISKNDIKASSHLIPLLDALLQKHNLKLKDLAFIAVDKGPGAFTSLRVTIATVNGLAAAANVPLIGISGLDALARQVSTLIPPNNDRLSMIVCLLNAYNNDVYYLLAPEKGTPWIGCKKIDDLLVDLVAKSADYQLWFAGNGFDLHCDLILGSFPRGVPGGTTGPNINIPAPFITLCSAESIGQIAYQQWSIDHKTVDQITPLYFKTQIFAVKK